MKSASELYEKAVAAADEGVSIRDFEQTFVEFLTCVKQHPETRREVEELLTAPLSDHRKPWSIELVTFCMHELRWDTVREAIEQRLYVEPDPSARLALEDVLASFEDDWEDRGLYDYYAV